MLQKPYYRDIQQALIQRCFTGDRLLMAGRRRLIHVDTCSPVAYTARRSDTASMTSVAALTLSLAAVAVPTSPANCHDHVSPAESTH